VGIRKLASAAAALACISTSVLTGPGAQAATDYGFGRQAWWFKSLDMAQVHAISTGKGVPVALIDTPVDPDVPELRDQHVVPVMNACTGTATGSGPADEHGTQMASLIVGNGQGTRAGEAGPVGLAPDATVRTYAVADSTYTQRSTYFHCSRAHGDAFADALRAAVTDGVRIVSMSVNEEDWSNQLQDAVDQAVNAGVVVVASVGNQPLDKTVSYPAALPGVVAVASMGPDGLPAKNNPDGGRSHFVISAPGEDITAGGFIDGRWVSSGYLVDGSSNATAFVSASLALVAAKYPTATGNQLIQTLIHNTAGDQPFGLTADRGYGVVSPLKMLSVDPTTYPDANPLVPAMSSPAPTPTASAVAPSTPLAERTDSGGTFPIRWLVLGAGIIALAAGTIRAVR
jgi:subtilisin family serine protease